MYKRISDFEFEEEFKKEEDNTNDNEVFVLENIFLKKQINKEVIRLSVSEFTFQEQNLSLKPVVDRLKNKKTLSLRGICKVPKNR